MKSHVSMEQAQCPVCYTVFDTGSILLDRRLKDSLEQHTCTHFELCKACKEKHEAGYVALIAVEGEQPRGKLGTEKRTGEIAHIRRTAFAKIFNMPEPEGPLAFCQPEVIEQLKQLTQ
jgi:hypothetical protein